jgi:hypothetical protein
MLPYASISAWREEAWWLVCHDYSYVLTGGMAIPLIEQHIRKGNRLGASYRTGCVSNAVRNRRSKAPSCKRCSVGKSNPIVMA